MMDDLFNIKEKVAVVTGGSGTLGGSISKYLAARGVKVAVMGRNRKKIDNILEEIRSNGGECSGLTADVLKTDQLKDARRLILEKWGQIHFLINTAGGNMEGATLAEDQTIFDMDIRDYNNVTDLNLNGTVYPCIVFGEAMKKNKYGSIINISSMATYASVSRVPGYSIAKSGVEMFTKWLAMEMAVKISEKIRVNAIAPGFFISSQNEKVLLNPDGSLTERSQKVLAKTPMGRFGHASELNGTVHFLCSEAAAFVTGTIIPVDGGFSSHSGI